jgi:RNA polymerase I-specific transcription initiation factor RRN6
LPASPIDAHPILSIGVENTGGYTHSDVTFNPNSQLQFAIIDQGYTWSIWNIEHPRKGDSYTASSILRGPIIDPEDTDATGEDGWSRILWIADGDTLVVCNRRHLKIVSIEGATFAYLSCPPMFGKNSTDWILDVKQHPKHRRRFIVLTSTRLIVMEVTTSRDASDGSTEDAGAAIVLSWRHYRSAEDFTLQMSMQIMSENGELNDRYL